MKDEKPYQDVARTEVKYSDKEGKVTTWQNAVRRLCIKYDEQGIYLGTTMLFAPKDFPKKNKVIG